MGVGLFLKRIFGKQSLDAHNLDSEPNFDIKQAEELSLLLNQKIAVTNKITTFLDEFLNYDDDKMQKEVETLISILDRQIAIVKKDIDFIPMMNMSSKEEKKLREFYNSIVRQKDNAQFMLLKHLKEKNPEQKFNSAYSAYMSYYKIELTLNNDSKSITLSWLLFPSLLSFVKRNRKSLGLFAILAVLPTCSSHMKNIDMSKTDFQRNNYEYSETVDTLTTDLTTDSTNIWVKNHVDSLRRADSIKVENEKLSKYSAINISKITCRFFKDERLRPVTDTSNATFEDYFRSHLGIDYVTNDKNIYSHGNGVVEEKYSDGGSEVIKIKYNSGDIGIYRHVFNPLVNKGDTISSGQQIGDMKGTDEKSTGGHCHYEHMRNGDYLDPMIVLGISNTIVWSLPPSKKEIQENPEKYMERYKSNLKYYRGAFDNLDNVG